MSTSEWWERLPADIREQVDGHVLQDADLQAVHVVFTVVRAHGLGLTDAPRVVHDRYRHHGDRVARTADSPPRPRRAGAAPGQRGEAAGFSRHAAAPATARHPSLVGRPPGFGEPAQPPAPRTGVADSVNA
ncbi:hypothetical protein ACFVZA_41710 [Streptomyces bottropensis]|uniref:hypothetical protein n=1 Tax=Streptomyces bottropensis TaxID=42235 RepID=UPI0036C963E8